MSEDLELVRESDSPFENASLPEACTKLIKADLAAAIIGILREHRLQEPLRRSWWASRRRISPAFPMPSSAGLPLTG